MGHFHLLLCFGLETLQGSFCAGTRRRRWWDRGVAAEKTLLGRGQSPQGRPQPLLEGHLAGPWLWEETGWRLVTGQRGQSPRHAPDGGSGLSVPGKRSEFPGGETHTLRQAEGRDGRQVSGCEAVSVLLHPWPPNSQSQWDEGRDTVRAPRGWGRPGLSVDRSCWHPSDTATP